MFWPVSLPSNGILPCAKFALRPNLAFYISVTARTAIELNFAAWYKEWNYGAFSPRSNLECHVSYTSALLLLRTARRFFPPIFDRTAITWYSRATSSSCATACKTVRPTLSDSDGCLSVCLS